MRVGSYSINPSFCIAWVFLCLKIKSEYSLTFFNILYYYYYYYFYFFSKNVRCYIKMQDYCRITAGLLQDRFFRNYL